jgi:hypothetical protein
MAVRPRGAQNSDAEPHALGASQRARLAFLRGRPASSGGETELEEVGGLLAGIRLLTLTGAGGSGKTRDTAADGPRRVRDLTWRPLGPDVFLGDGSVAPLSDGHHATSALELAHDAGPFPRPEPDRVRDDPGRRATR